MILPGRFAGFVWVVLYVIPAGFAWLYLRYVAHRGGFWQILHVLVFLLLGATCGFIAYSAQYMFVVAPFIGYALAGIIASASIPMVNKKYREWLSLPNQRKPSKPSNLGEKSADTKEGQLVRYELIVSAEEARSGTTKILIRNGRKLEVSVPAGVTTGSVVTLSNALQITDEHPGDILIQIIIREG